MILLFCIKIDINWEHDWKGYGKANENKNGKKNQDDKNWRLLLTAVDIICDNECIWETYSFKQKRYTHSFHPSGMTFSDNNVPLNFVQKHKINHKFLLKIKTFDMEYSVYIHTIR